MDIDKNKLAQMREESKDTLNILEDALSTNADDETTIEVEVEETAAAPGTAKPAGAGDVNAGEPLTEEQKAETAKRIAELKKLMEQ